MTDERDQIILTKITKREIVNLLYVEKLESFQLFRFN